MTNRESNDSFLLSNASPDRAQLRFAGAVLASLVAALLISLPFARIPTAGTEILLPALAAAVFLVELLTAALLMALFSIQNSRAILTLAIGYLFQGLLVIPWVLTIPDVFTALGVTGNIQSTATISAIRRLSFPLFVIAYVLSSHRDRVGEPQHSSGLMIARWVVLTVIVAFAVSCYTIVEADKLPRLMTDTWNIAPLWQYVPGAAFGVYSIALVLLWFRRNSTLDLWLGVVLCAMLVESIMLSYVTGGTRLNFGWWAARLLGLASASLVLLVLLSDTMTLQARLARSILSERLARRSRLTSMEALSASIAHEVNQPLAGIVTNANTGLRLLKKSDPEVLKALAILERIVRDGLRARDVIDSTKKLFSHSIQDRIPINLNRLIEDVLQQSRDDARFAQVSISVDLDEGLPAITGNSLQLQQVISNLIANAAEAMRNVTDQPRVIHVISGRGQAGEIMVSIEDCGPGIDPQLRDRIFEPFFTTKPEGMGMGLMFSRSIIENHGGTLWATDNMPHGANFHITLPAGDDGTGSTKGL